MNGSKHFKSAKIMKLLCLVISFSILAVGFTGCGVKAQPAASSSEGEASLTSEGGDKKASAQVQSVDLKDYGQLTKEFLLPAAQAWITASSWSKAEELRPECFTALYYQQVLLKKTEEWDTSEVPAKEVETEVQKYIDVSANHIKLAPEYDAKKDVYTFENGIGSSEAAVVGAQQNGNQLVLSYEYYSMADKTKVIRKGTLTIELTGDGYKYTSCKAEDVVVPSTSSSGNNETEIIGEPVDKNSPIVQKAFLTWKSFGGYPGFTNVNAMTSALVGELYANYCNSNAIPIAFTVKEKSGSKWMKPEPVEQFAKKYFNVEPDQLHDKTDYYDERKGYQYPLVFPADPESVQIMSAEKIDNEQMTLKIKYIFDLPAEFYSKPGKAKAIHTVVFRYENDNIKFISAEIIDERMNYSE